MPRRMHTSTSHESHTMASTCTLSRNLKCAARFGVALERGEQRLVVCVDEGRPTRKRPLERCQSSFVLILRGGHRDEVGHGGAPPALRPCAAQRRARRGLEGHVTLLVAFEEAVAGEAGDALAPCAQRLQLCRERVVAQGACYWRRSIALCGAGRAPCSR